jgi:8-oxo-dGTP pyrophosphatase MutT (NUDIX family)
MLRSTHVEAAAREAPESLAALRRFDALEAALRAALGRPLPGAEAQARMGRTPRELRRLPYDHLAGVLVLAYPVEAAPHLVLTLRSANLRRHRGQVSFPGGIVEPGEDVRAAALREAQEEVGVRPEEVEVVGSLSPLPMPHTGFVLHPVVGLARVRPDLRPCEVEVARVLEVPLSDLADPARLRREPRRIGERLYDVPFFEVAGEKVWGATAMVLAELLELLGAPPRLPVP